VGLKLAPMSGAFCAVFVSIAADVLIFRKILAKKNLVSDTEYESELEVLERRLGL
jgi:hypothetical protein